MLFDQNSSCPMFTRFFIGLVPSLVMLVSLKSHGLELSYGIFSEAEYSDNPYQQAERPGTDLDTEGGTKLNAGLRFELEQSQSASWLIGAQGEFERERYPQTETRDSQYQDNKQASVDLLYKPTSNNFRLNVVNSYQQTLADQTSTQEFGNRQDVNIFSVEPSYFVRVGERSQIDVFYRYIRVDEEFEFTSREVDAVGTSYSYALSNRFAWSLNAVRSKTEYTDLPSEYEQDDLFTRVAYDSGLTRLSLDVGVQEITNADDARETLLAVSALRRLNSASVFTVNYRSGYSDAFRTDVANEISEVSANEDVVYFDGVAIEKEWSAQYTYQRANFVTDLRYSTSEVKSDTAILVFNPVDEERRRAEAEIDYILPFTRYLLSFLYAYEHRNVNEQVFVGREASEIYIHEAIFEASYLASPRFRVYAQIGKRTADDDAIGLETDENTALIGFEYSTN